MDEKSGDIVGLADEDAGVMVDREYEGWPWTT